MTRLVVSFVLVGCLVAALAAEGPRQVTVKSLGDLQKAVSKARPGDIIVLADGEYKGKGCRLAGKGAKDRPIVIRAQTTGKATIRCRVDLGGEYASLVGMRFTDRGMVQIKGKGCRLSRCKFSNVQSGFWVRVQLGSSNIEVDHCLFEKKEINRKMKRGCQLLKLDVLNKNERHHVHHNHFRDIPQGSGNGFETIQLITKGNPKDPGGGSCNTVIENNLFERCNGEAEIISIKSNGNVIRGNTFRACRGSLVLRHGHGNVASQNFFFADGESGSGGVRLQGRDQVVSNNYFHGLGSGVSMMDGTTDKLYVRVERAKILFNTFIDCTYSMRIGLNHSKYPNGTVPKQCLVAGNFFCLKNGENQIITYVKNDQPEDWKWIDNIAQGKLGIPAMNGIREGDPKLRMLQNCMVPTAGTPSTEHVFKEITTDLLGTARGKRKTLGAVQYPVKTEGPKPLTAGDVGPQAGVR